MYIKKVSLNNFRNYEEQDVEFENGINIIYGNNGEGKTNIIESIYLSSIGKSFRTSKEKELIKFNKDFCKINIDFQKSDREGNLKIDINEKKSIYLNNIKLKKTSEILGNIYMVLFNPNDMDILRQGPIKRRQFLNIMISQLRPNFVHVLNDYIKALEQRNSYLRQIKYENKSKELLDIWDEKLSELGEKIYLYRLEFINKIIEKINNVHSKITKEKEFVKIKYNSDCKNKAEFINKLKVQREIDIQRGFTTVGIHRDDFSIFINDKQVNIYGSQGQQRTIMISLKICELEIIYDEIGEYPVLLLDDFMSELDKERINSFMESIKNNQIIITCTEKMNIENCKKYLKVENGKVLC